MFFNSQNSMFPFQMPNMNGQMPFPFQMPNMNGQMPFPFQMPNMSGQMPFQFPFPNPFGMGQDKTEDEETAAECEDAQADDQQQFNPFEFFQQMFRLQQFMDMFKNMFPMFNMNQQNCGCQQGFNPFGEFQMPNMNAQMQQFMDMFKNMFPMFNMNQQNCGCQQGFNPFGFFHMPNTNMQQQVQQFTDMLKNCLSSFGMAGCNQANGLPFGMPVKLLQILLHMDSTPEGLSKFQKILDLIFDEYSKSCKPAEE